MAASFSGKPCPAYLEQAFLTSRSGLWGFISSTAWPLLTSITWESPSQATCSIFPRMKVTTPVVPHRRLWRMKRNAPSFKEARKNHLKAFPSLTRGQTRCCSSGQPVPGQEQAVLSSRLRLFRNGPSGLTWLNAGDGFCPVTPLALASRFWSWAMLLL